MSLRTVTFFSTLTLPTLLFAQSAPDYIELQTIKFPEPRRLEVPVSNSDIAYTHNFVQIDGISGKAITCSRDGKDYIVLYAHGSGSIHAPLKPASVILGSCSFTIKNVKSFDHCLAEDTPAITACQKEITDKAKEVAKESAPSEKPSVTIKGSGRS